MLLSEYEIKNAYNTSLNYKGSKVEIQWRCGLRYRTEIQTDPRNQIRILHQNLFVSLLKFINLIYKKTLAYLGWQVFLFCQRVNALSRLVSVLFKFVYLTKLFVF